MKIETVRATEKIEVEKIVARYSQEEIVDLIRKDLEAHGYKVENISVLTDTKYIGDEWGMITYLKGIEAVVTPDGQKY